MKKFKFTFQNGYSTESEIIEYDKEPTEEELEKDRLEFFFDRCSLLGIEAWAEEIENAN
nr:MAG TPA: hypothetical protein [Caudoviricetes sp.]